MSVPARGRTRRRVEAVIHQAFGDILTPMPLGVLEPGVENAFNARQSRLGLVERRVLFRRLAI